MMVQRFVVVLLMMVLLVLVGCGDEFTEDEEKALKDLVKDKVADEKEIIWEKDGKEMVLIPAGSFEMGDHLDNMGNALPVHTVELEAFYMDVNEVTVGQFKRFAEESGYAYDRWNSVAKYSPTDGYPMIYDSWDDATAYAKWASKRLPTEAEWEYVARGGLGGKRYPWGDDESVARDYANFAGTNGKDKWGRTTAPVGSFKPNGYGLFDMSGNVWEWCQDWYDSDEDSRVLQGGSCLSNTPDLRVVPRLSGLHPTSRYNFNGVRCVSGLN